MDKPMTIARLHMLCEQFMKSGCGDYVIMLSDDDEGNGYHYCWYDFSKASELITEDEVDKDIAPLDKTIILG